jgi:putative hemolysin
MKGEIPERDRYGRRNAGRAEIQAITALGTSALAVVALIQTSISQLGKGRLNEALEGGFGSAWLPYAVVGGFIVAVALNSLYVAAETAISLLRPLHIKHVQEKSAKKSERLQRIYERKPSLLAACALGRQMSKLVLIFVGLLLAPGLLITLNQTAGWSFNFETFLLAVLIVVLPMGLLNLIIELIPKSFASLHPHRVASFLDRFVSFSASLFSIPTSLVTSVAGILTSRFGGRATFDIQNQAEEEIKTLVESAQEAGEIEEEEREMLHSVFDFTETVAREVMTPRVDLDAMPIRSDPAQVIQVIRDTGHSRIPLYEETDDQIIGIVHAKDLLLAAVNGPDKVNLRDLMRPPLFVPESKNLHDLLAEMRATRNQLAIVQDEFGGTAGIVTIEDIVEELVGDIVDEYDIEEPEIVEEEQYYIVGGKAHLDDVNEALGANLDASEFDTIGGYVFGLFGRQPKLGECIENEGWNFCVVETDGRRIMRLRLEPISVEAEQETADLAD